MPYPEYLSSEDKTKNVICRPNLLSTPEFERWAFENSDGVILGSRHDPERTRRTEIHRIDWL